MRVLVADNVAPAAIEILRAEESLEVVVSNPKEYRAHIADAQALLVRSGVRVTKEVLDTSCRTQGDRPSWSRRGQHRLRRSHQARNRGHEHSGRQRHVSGGAHHGTDPFARTRSALRQSVDSRGALGTQEVPRQRGVRQNARHNRPRQHRASGRPARQALRHGGHCIRPVRFKRCG